MKLISWNIDSLNAALEHTSNRGIQTFQILQSIALQKPDFFSIQETKLKQGDPINQDLFSNNEIIFAGSKFPQISKKQINLLNELFPDYYSYWNFSKDPAKKGYAGTLILAKKQANDAQTPQIETPDTMDFEGRIITLEYPSFYVSTVYTPNSGDGLKRLNERIVWDRQYKKYLNTLNQNKPVIFSGDFNVAHHEIDLKNDATNHHSPGFTDEERSGFTNLLDSGFTDIWRSLNPKSEQYTWWAQRNLQSKINNTGWRIDYYLISNQLVENVVDAGIIDTGTRADHAPIYLDINLNY
ncbi:MAG: exodeoxyribonuclease III [Lactobacillaceae bacterium]|nr:exodeoxyribonuclease III [Lactobacillaceae bacterium]